MAAAIAPFAGQTGRFPLIDAEPASRCTVTPSSDFSAVADYGFITMAGSQMFA
jgi:hypothetical protein